MNSHILSTKSMIGVKHHYPKVVIALFTLLCCGSPILSAQVSADFEGILGQNLQTPCLYVDPDGTTTHVLQNFTDPDCGVISVQSPSAGSSMGFEITFSSNGNGSGGVSEGDGVGVATAPALSFHLGTSAAQGSQAFLTEDIDGAISMKFDVVDLTGVASMVSLQYFLDGGSWETADFLNVYVDITGCPSATTVSLINVDGDAIESMGLENSWNTISADLSAYANCNAQLYIEHSSDSNSEEMGIDDIQFTQGTLPIELKSFQVSAIDKTVELDWETAGEINNEGFEVQHSINARDWNTLTFVEGNGTSFQEHRYDYLHEEPLPGLNYYRLKQMDYNGAFDYSVIKVAVLEGSDPSDRKLAVLPNPAADWLSVALPEALQNKNQLSFRIYNQLGRVVRVGSKEIGRDGIRFEIDDLSDGFYFLEVMDNGLKYTAKFVKQ